MELHMHIKRYFTRFHFIYSSSENVVCKTLLRSHRESWQPFWNYSEYLWPLKWENAFYIPSEFRLASCGQWSWNERLTIEVGYTAVPILWQQETVHLFFRCPENYVQTDSMGQGFSWKANSCSVSLKFLTFSL